MKKRHLLILLAMFLVLVMMVCVACGDKGADGDTPDPAPSGTYTVTLELQNGQPAITLSVDANSTVPFPENPTKDYATFRGWFKNSDGTGLWSKTTKVTEDVTIYACWNTVYGKVRLNLNYTGAPAVQDVQKPLGEAFTLEDPTRDCWVFAGWYTDSALTTPYDLSQVFTANTLMLYAKWELDPTHVHDYEVTKTPMSCTSDGYDTHVCACGDKYVDNVIPACGHNFTFSDTDYLGMVWCENEGCETAGRKPSERNYDDKFVITFDSEKEAEINARYQQLIDTLNSIAKYNADLHYYDYGSDRYYANKAFEDVYNAFYDDLIYLVEQYYYSYVYYCVQQNEINTQVYEHIQEYRTGLVSDFYALYRLIYETEFREYFFCEADGWTQEDIEYALTMSDSYGDDNYVAINNRITAIELEFREIEKVSESDRVLELYEEFVSLNNQIAKLAGYEDYITYAYENVYDRDYTPEQTSVMRNLVKDNLIQAYNKVLVGYRSSGSVPNKSTEAGKIYNALANESIFNSKVATDIVKAYFEAMNSTTAGAKEIDFYKHANDLFRNGNYFTGMYSGAFSAWISAQQASILYFGPNSYSSPFTFIHEFGHYYNNIYNGDTSVTLDLDEVHSQGDEMLFLSFLEDYLPNAVLRDMYRKLYYDQLFNMFAIIMLATAVDEFEYCVYTGTTPDGEPATYTKDDYDDLFADIMVTYGISNSLNSSYWRYVVIESPCYYISYAMSALPCVELLSIAQTQGFDVARDTYFKCFTFTDVADHVEIDEMGDKIVTLSYADTLKYAGLSSVFEQDLYTHLVDYFVNSVKDFSYPDVA